MARAPPEGGAREAVWLVVAAALAAFLVWRRRKLEPTLIAGGAIVAVAARGLRHRPVKLPNLERR